MYMGYIYDDYMLSSLCIAYCAIHFTWRIWKAFNFIYRLKYASCPGVLDTLRGKRAASGSHAPIHVILHFSIVKCATTFAAIIHANFLIPCKARLDSCNVLLYSTFQVSPYSPLTAFKEYSTSWLRLFTHGRCHHMTHIYHSFPTCTVFPCIRSLHTLSSHAFVPYMHCLPKHSFPTCTVFPCIRSLHATVFPCIPQPVYMLFMQFSAGNWKKITSSKNFYFEKIV